MYTSSTLHLILGHVGAGILTLRAEVERSAKYEEARFV